MGIRRYIPSMSKLWQSVRLRSKECLRENTLHGVPYFMNPIRPIWERVAWFICTMASIGGAIGIIITVLDKFQTYPTLTGMDVETDELVLFFPGITLCQKMPKFGGNLDALETEHYNSVFNWSWNSVNTIPNLYKSEESYSTFFIRSTPDCSALYTNCVNRSKSIPCGEFFEKELAPRGICCSIAPSRILLDTNPWEISFSTNAFPISLDFHHESNSPALRDSQASYILKSGVTMKIVMKFTHSSSELNYLRRSQRQCLHPSEARSYSICFHQCQAKAMMKMCRCVPWYLAYLAETNECDIQKYNCLAGNATTLQNLDCGCYLSCNHTSYVFETIETLQNNSPISIIMNYWPAIAYKREVRFGWLDLLVSFGGIAGLFIGYSLLTTVELIYYFTLRSYCGVVHTIPDKTIQTKVKKAKVPKRKIINVTSATRKYHEYTD